MSIIDTSLLIDRMREGKKIDENVSMISVIEHPMLMAYARFSGRVLYPELEDLERALELQRKLVERGKMKSSSDLIIAATCINYGETLLTADKDFEDISKVSDLKVAWE
jgi:PIN domain